MADSLEKELAVYNIKTKSYKIDVSKFDDTQKLVEDVLKDFGSLDILVNNAGITKDNLLLRMNEEDFNNVIDVNLKSVFNMTKASQKYF